MSHLSRCAVLTTVLVCAAAPAAQAWAKDLAPPKPGQVTNKITCHRECDTSHVQWLVCYGPYSPAPTVKKTGLVCI